MFCAERKELAKRALAKLKSKNADIVVANDVSLEGAGFDTRSRVNIATIMTATGRVRECELMSKRMLADIILDELNAL